jgi:phospholipid/cholesterol/gamma-HCH transport system permease protein
VTALVRSLRAATNPMSRLVFLRQVYYTAVRSMRLLFVVALLVGGAFIVQATYFLGADERLYDLITVVLVRHIAPLMAAIVIIGRSATSISTELALMRCTGEIDALRKVRVPAREYLVAPRVSAVVLATVGACLFCQVIAVLGGFALSSVFLDVHFGEQLGRLAQKLSVAAFAIGVLKSASFGLVIAWVACSVGLVGAARMEDVPVVPSKAFLRSLLGVLLIDVLALLLLIHD